MSLRPTIRQVEKGQEWTAMGRRGDPLRSDPARTGRLVAVPATTRGDCSATVPAISVASHCDAEKGCPWQ